MGERKGEMVRVVLDQLQNFSKSSAFLNLLMFACIFMIMAQLPTDSKIESWSADPLLRVGAHSPTALYFHL